MKATINAILPYFGGKRTMGDDIAKQLGEHRQYFEPFCGSLAVLFAKPPCTHEMVNDLHRDVTNLAWVLQGEETAAVLYNRACRTLFAEAMIRELWIELGATPCPDAPDADRAYKFLVVSWAMRNGVAGTSRMRGNGFSIALRFTPGGGSPTVRLKGVVDSIPEWHERLRNVVITRRDAFEMLPRFDDSPNLAIYADPPYMSETRTGYAAAGARSQYVHEFDHDSPLLGDDHDRLHAELSRFTHARVVVSYYDCPRLRNLYTGWTFIDFGRRKNIQNGSGSSGGEKDAPEVLIVNGDVL